MRFIDSTISEAITTVAVVLIYDIIDTLMSGQMSDNLISRMYCQ